MKHGLLLCLMTGGSFFVYLCYTVVAPFVPGEISRRGLSPVYNGVIIALMSLNGFFMPPLVQSQILPRFGFSGTITMGAFTLALSLLFFGVASFFQNNVSFLILTCISRIFQGVAGTMVYQPSHAIIGIAFADNVGRASSIFNIGMTVGLACGPFLGGLLYSWIGYTGPFFLFGGLTLCYWVVNLFFNLDKALPPSSHVDVSHFSESLSLKDACSNVVSYLSYQQKPFLGYVVYFFSLSCLIFFEPILADKLTDTFGYSSDQVAYFYARFTLASLVGNVLMIALQWKQYTWLMASIGFGISGIGCVLLAPSGFILNTETTPLLLTLGLVCLGIGWQVLLSAASALTLNSLNSLFPGRSTEVSKLFSRVRINVAASAFLLAPFLTSLVANETSYEATCNGVGLILLTLFMFYSTYTFIGQPGGRRNSLQEPLLQQH